MGLILHNHRGTGPETLGLPHGSEPPVPGVTSVILSAGPGLPEVEFM